MKKHLNGILVVEGKEDASYLSNYIASEIVVVNGFELNDNLISYLKNKKVIVLSDPDEAGKTIRKQLNDRLNNVDNVEIDIAKCSRGRKSRGSSAIRSPMSTPERRAMRAASSARP